MEKNGEEKYKAKKGLGSRRLAEKKTDIKDRRSHQVKRNRGETSFTPIVVGEVEGRKRIPNRKGKRSGQAPSPGREFVQIRRSSRRGC